jgi:two-component system OmpR family response regulator
LRALIADDTKNIRKLLGTCLELKGYQVFEASNGQDALKIAMEEAVDIAFIDIKMPEITGTEVLRRIRQMGLNFPVVIMTAFATVKNAIDCTKLGAVLYLQKPFSSDKIMRLIDTLPNILKEQEYTGYNYNYAAELIEKSNFETSYDYLKKALSDNPGNGEIYYLIGKLFESNNKIGAEKFYSAAKLFGFDKKE